MLPREQRLRQDRDFTRVYRAGRSWAHPLLALHVLPQPSGQRFGISASKKVGKAVVRNRVRRRIREILRRQSAAWKTGVDGVIVARAAAAGAPFAELDAAVAELARRARLVREPGGAPDTPYTMAGGRPAEARGKPRRPEGRASGMPTAGGSPPAGGEARGGATDDRADPALPA